MKKLSLLFAAFLDRLSLAIALVVFPPMFADSSYAAMFGFVPSIAKPMLLGVTLAVYFVGQFLSNGLFGRLSDSYGRKFVLMTTFTGSLVGFSLVALGIDLQWLSIVLLGRFLTGIFAANYAVALSSLSDTSAKQDRVHNFSLLEVAMSVGFICAGLVGGNLINSQVVSWFSYSIPFWTVAGLIAVNVVVLKLFFQETLHTPKLLGKINLLDGVTYLHKAFVSVHLRRIYLIWLLFAIGWQSCLQFYSSLLLKFYGFAPKQISLVFMIMGGVFIVSQLILVKPAAKKRTSLLNLRWSMVFVSFAIGMLILAGSKVLVVAVLVLYTLSVGVVSPNMFSMVSNLAYHGEQGEALGIMVTIKAMAVIIATLVGGILMSQHVTYPFILGSLAALGSWVLLMFFKSNEEL